jgi:hypothetical protein
MEVSPSWEANSYSTTQHSKKPEVHYRVYNSPQLVPPPEQINPIYILPYYFFVDSL